MNNQPSTPNRVEADLIIRHTVAEFVEEHGNDTTGNPAWGWTRLQLDIALYPNQLHRDRLLEVVEAMDNAARVEAGTHEQIERNAAGTVDNTEELAQHFDTVLTERLNSLLNSSGYANGYTNGTGRDLLLTASKNFTEALTGKVA